MPLNVVYSAPAGTTTVRWGDAAPPPPPAPAPALSLTGVPSTGTLGVAANGGLVTNTGNVTTEWAVASTPADVLVSPASGTLSPGANVAFTLTALVAGSKSIALTSATPGTVITGSPVAFDVPAPPPPPPAPGPDWQNAGIYVLGLSPTYYTLGWPRVKYATGYEYSLDDGASWTSTGTTPYAEVTGRTAGTTDLIRVRASNGTGTSEITGSVTLPASGAPTVTRVTVGTGGDYSTPQAAEDAKPLNLVSANVIYEIRLLAQEFSTASITTTGTDIQGSTTDATRYTHITAAPGAAFCDHEDRRTNPLRYNAAVGAALTHNAGAYTIITLDLREGFARASRLQVRSTGNNTSGFGGYAIHTSTAATTCRFDQCILESGTASFVLSPYGPHIARDCVVINTRPTGTNIVGEFSLGGKVYNCLFVSTRNKANFALGTVGASGGAWNSIFANVNGFVSGGATPTLLGNVSDMSTPPTGIASVAYNTTTGMGFENITWPNHDFRLKSTSALRGAAATAPEMRETDITNTKRPATISQVDIGPWQT